MGDVYLAEDPHIERQLAIKTVRIAEGKAEETEDRKRRLLREAKAAGRLIHPHVITLFDAGEAEGILYLAFEYVNGPDLSARIDSPPPLTLGEVLRIARETADALDFAHHHGIVHRDIKPANILLDGAGRVKVADFGIAKMVGQQTELTMTGSVVGSPHYLSPEQVRGEDLDGRTDIFSLGVVLYELLGHRRPFSGESLTTLVYQILHQDPPPIPALRPGIAPRLEQLVRRMIAKDREQRFPTAGALVAEIAACERGLPAESLSEPVGQAQEPLDATHRLPSSGAAPPAATSGVSGASPPPAAVGGSSGAGSVPSAGTPSAAPAVAAAPPVKRRVLPWILLGLGVFLVGLLTAAWFLFGSRVVQFVASRQSAAAVAANATTPEKETARPPSVPASPEGTAAVREPAKEPAAEPPKPVPAASTPPPRAAAESSPAKKTTPATPSLGSSGNPPAPAPESGLAPPPSPTPAKPAVSLHPPPTRPVEPPTVPESAPEAPAALPASDRQMTTGLALALRVVPPDAYVKMREVGEERGRVIGQASEYSAQGREGRPYSLPGPGDYLFTFSKEGLRDYRILIHAQPGGTTQVQVNLAAPASGGQGAGADLVRVREAIVLKVEPEGAVVYVDGTQKGAARDFSGGFLKGKTLKLDPGTHRIRLVAPGYKVMEFSVEVSPAAEKDKQTVPVALTRG